jgi:hypothetical protein
MAVSAPGVKYDDSKTPLRFGRGTVRIPRPSAPVLF